MIIDSSDNLITLSASSLGVLASEEEEIYGGGDDSDPDVHKHDSVAKSIPWFVYSTILL